MAATAVHFSLICAIFDFIYLTFKQPTWLEHFYEHIPNISVTCGTVLWSWCGFNRERKGAPAPISLAGLVPVRSGPGPLMAEVGRMTWTRLSLDTQRHQMPTATPSFSLVPGAQGLCLGHPTGVCVLSHLLVLLRNEDFHSLFPFTE